jgi:hypothetical protein
LSQLAAPAAFGCRAELDAHVARYRANRDLLIATLTEAGLTRFAPAEGAFYLYVDVSALTRDSQGFCRRMLDETGSRRPRAAISTRSTATTGCGCRSPARRRTSPRPPGGFAGGSRGFDSYRWRWRDRHNHLINSSVCLPR